MIVSTSVRDQRSRDAGAQRWHLSAQTRSVDAAHAVSDGGRVLKGRFRSIIRCVTQSGKRPRSVGRRQTADKEGHLDAIGLAAK
jgi:hypothetical protein